VIVLVDADSVAYRSFFALSHYRGSEDVPAGLVYGTAVQLRRMAQELVPEVITFCWGDKRENLWRRSIAPDYKAQRTETPSDFSTQCAVMMELLSAMGVAQVKCSMFEADDVLAALTKHAISEGRSVGIVTGDHDMQQLIQDGDPFVKVFMPPKERGGPYTVMGEKEVTEKWGVPPKSLPMLFAIRGEKGDGIPGIYGIGKVKARDYLLGKASKSVRDKIASERELIKHNLKLVDLSFISIDDLGGSVLPVETHPMVTTKVMAALKKVGLLNKPATLQTLKEFNALYEQIRERGAHSLLELYEELGING